MAEQVHAFLGSLPFAVLFVLLWLLVSVLISVMGGWIVLARKYRRKTPENGRFWTFQSARLRYATRYKNMLTVGATESGLNLAVFFPFRLLHPPLLIPWSDVRKGELDSTGLVRRLTFTGVPTTYLMLYESLVKKIETELGREISAGP